ncbi:MAG: tail fiber domain-containing protein [Proteobacteria bacterium]|uniref:tail fiber domain-containing protein n=1 Tax=Rudaea sp. TaxID=2136325 RepID=UPI00321F6325|nr:tail fiber domain-containing protein [Pseudomonadota bacterium]
MTRQRAQLPMSLPRLVVARSTPRPWSLSPRVILCTLLLAATGAHGGAVDPGAAAGDNPATRPDFSLLPSGQRPRTAGVPVLSMAQSEEMRARIELAHSIVQNVAADAAGKRAREDWPVGLSSVLYATPSATLRAIAASASTLDEAHAMARADALHGVRPVAEANSFGSASDSLIFTPITPCRFIDTRNVGGGIVAPRQFDTSLDGSNYGGATGCVLPPGGEAGIAANVTIVVPGTAAAGYLGIRPVGNTALTSFINWPAGGTLGWANAGTLSAARNGSGNYAFEVFASGGSPNVIVDYFGYFAAGPAGTANQTLRYDSGNALVANNLLKAFSDGGLLAGGTADTGTIPATGTGVRMMWYPAKAAFRAGRIDGTQWDDANVGATSFAMGYNTVASGASSTALGNFTKASGSYSTALGANTTASGPVSLALGFGATASGLASVASGGSFASGDYSVALGIATASGNRSIAMGSGGTTADGNYSTAMGVDAHAQNDFSFMWNGDPNRIGGHTNSDGDFYVSTGAVGRAWFFAGGVHDCYLAATGAAGWQCSSDRNLKTAIVPTDGSDVLARLVALPVSSWEFKKDRGSKHIGPMAQDFKAAFGLGGADDKSIGSTDAQGVALAAIKGLNVKLEQALAATDGQIAELRRVHDAQIAALRRELAEANAQARAAQTQAATAQAAVAALSNVAHDVALLKARLHALQRTAAPVLAAATQP